MVAYVRLNVKSKVQLFNILFYCNFYFSIFVINVYNGKLTESNNEYYLCCEIYSNNIRIVQDIRIFEYFRIIFDAKMKDLLKYKKTLCFVKMPSVFTIIRPKLNYHSFCFLLNKYLFK